MDHVVYLDAEAKEMDKLLAGEKTMIIRGAAGRKMPYGRVNENDMLYFINNNAEGLVKTKALVSLVVNSEKMTKEESVQLTEEHKDKLNLTAAQFKRWVGKRYLVLVELSRIEKVDPFRIDKSDYGNMDDWLPVGEISKIMVK